MTDNCQSERYLVIWHIVWLHFQQENEELDSFFYSSSVPATPVVVPPSNKVWFYVGQNNIYCDNNNIIFYIFITPDFEWNHKWSNEHLPFTIYAERIAIKIGTNSVHTSSHLAKWDKMPDMQQILPNPGHWVPRQYLWRKVSQVKSHLFM